MILTHSGESYECDVAVKCEYDNYIILYKNGAEIAAFNNISDFTDYVLSGGSFIAPRDFSMPIHLSVYTIGSRTISVSDWVLSEDGTQYYYEIASSIISGNTTTCNVFLLFAQGTELEYTSKQESGKITLYTEEAPLAEVVIDSVQIFRT